MRWVAAVFVLGLGLGACGLIDNDMYAVGAVIIFIAVVGVAVRLGEATRAALAGEPDHLNR